MREALRLCQSRGDCALEGSGVRWFGRGKGWIWIAADGERGRKDRDDGGKSVGGGVLGGGGVGYKANMLRVLCAYCSCSSYYQLCLCFVLIVVMGVLISGVGLFVGGGGGRVIFGSSDRVGLVVWSGTRCGWLHRC